MIMARIHRNLKKIFFFSSSVRRKNSGKIWFRIEIVLIGVNVCGYFLRSFFMVVARYCCFMVAYVI